MNFTAFTTLSALRTDLFWNSFKRISLKDMITFKKAPQHQAPGLWMPSELSGLEQSPTMQSTKRFLSLSHTEAFHFSFCWEGLLSHTGGINPDFSLKRWNLISLCSAITHLGGWRTHGYWFLLWLWAKQTIMTVIKPSCRSCANNPTSLYKPFQNFLELVLAPKYIFMLINH